jgi:hypothetical protein
MFCYKASQLLVRMTIVNQLYYLYLWTQYHHLGLRVSDRLGRHKVFCILSVVYGSMNVMETGEGSGVGLGRAFDEDSYCSAILQAILGRSFLFVSVIELWTRKDTSLPPPRLSRHGVASHRLQSRDFD